MRDAPFAEPEAVRLEELRLTAQEARIEALLGLGRHVDVVAGLETLVREHPTRERFWALLMTSLYRADRQADALAAYGRARDTLAEELGIDPGEALRQLEVGILRQDPALAAPAPASASAGEEPTGTVMPRAAARAPVPLTSTVGRDELVGTVLGRLARPDARVVTLTGLGGSGKSRVASLAAAVLEAELGPDRVAFLTVTEQTSSEQLLREAALVLAGRVGPDPLGDLAEATTAVPEVADARALLVLDNLEALRDGSDLVHTLATGCPGLTLLVTSRVALAAPAEWEIPVPPLEVPADGATPAQTAASPAVQLFVDRAEAADPAFRLAGQETDVAALCRLLDGVPLALELAAARLALLPVSRLVTTLSEGLELLSTGSAAVPERHRSLTATIEWSYLRLDDVAQRMCDRLALFERGFTIEALEAVCSDLPSVLETLGEIVAARLVRPVETRVEVRFVVLGTVRAHVRQRLLAHDDLDELRDRLARHLLQQLESWKAGLDGPDGLVALGRFDDEAADVAASVDWAVGSGRSALAAGLAVTATGFWVASGRLHDGLQRLLAVQALPDLDQATGARVAAATAWLHYQLTDWSAAVEIAREALAGADAATDPETVAVARCAAAGAMVVSGSAEEGAELAEQCLADARAAQLYPWTAVASSVVAIGCAVRGDFDGERAAYTARLHDVRRHGDTARTADTLNTLAEIALDEDDAETARAYAQESLELAAGAPAAGGPRREHHPGQGRGRARQPDPSRTAPAGGARAHRADRSGAGPGAVPAHRRRPGRPRRVGPDRRTPVRGRPDALPLTVGGRGAGGA